MLRKCALIEINIQLQTAPVRYKAVWTQELLWKSGGNRTQIPPVSSSLAIVINGNGNVLLAVFEIYINYGVLWRDRSRTISTP
jgi:phage-related protein